MPENSKYKLTLLAENDIKEIWYYSVNRWGEKQAEKYIRQLEKRFEWLATNPESGIKRDDVKVGYCSYYEEKQTIFYRIVNDGIVVIGVPHQNEDVTRHSYEN